MSPCLGHTVTGQPSTVFGSLWCDILDLLLAQGWSAEALAKSEAWPCQRLGVSATTF